MASCELFAMTPLLDDFRTWWSDIRLARPSLLLITLVAPAFVLLNWFIIRLNRQVLRQYKGYEVFPGSLAGRPRLKRGLTLCGVPGVLCLCLGLAGPQWGSQPTTGVAVGRDVVLVLDLSQSMLAEDLQSTQPRWRSAVEHAQQMVSELQFRGGHRVGVVVFAARPSVVVPLSTDLGFVSVRLAELNANNPPSDILATGAEGSGTRIGRALQLATGLHTPQNTLAQDIVLFTDADDPADDGDWRLGIAATREAQIPVHVVGIGDAERATQLQLSGLAAPVSTRLRNEVARSIALEGRGTYLHAGRELVDVRPWLQRLILTALTRQYEVDGIRHRIDRSAWFYGIAAVLLLAYFVVR